MPEQQQPVVGVSVEMSSLRSLGQMTPGQAIRYLYPTREAVGLTGPLGGGGAGPVGPPGAQGEAGGDGMGLPIGTPTELVSHSAYPDMEGIHSLGMAAMSQQPSNSIWTFDGAGRGWNLPPIRKYAGMFGPTRIASIFDYGEFPKDWVMNSDMRYKSNVVFNRISTHEFRLINPEEAAQYEGRAATLEDIREVTLRHYPVEARHLIRWAADSAGLGRTDVPDPFAAERVQVVEALNTWSQTSAPTKRKKRPKESVESV